jgi:selenocysteine lyase/cysteine desulfurase
MHKWLSVPLGGGFLYVKKENIQGCRITPNIYTTPKELDQLVKALNEMEKA